ncbi:MAG: 50S ribosome-binding GTPase [Bacilli bacterium]|nr:50S ribosome-binding GTPase [Bacilli bacterium]
MNKCIGCGSILQDTDKNKDGYVLDINDKLCQRCFRIRYYNEYKNTIRDNNDYLKILDSINNDDLVVYVTSLLDIRLDYIDSFKNVIVVLTKRDILPKSVKDEKLIKYIKSRYNPLEVIVVSSVKNYNIDYLFDTLRQYKKNNIYVVGTTNGGKSTLINKIIKNYSDNDVVITSSMYPSTTLDKIEINILGLNVIDTPGLINKGSIVNYIDNNLLKKITIKKEIKPKTYQLNGKGSILIEDLIRLDYDTKGTSMTIYVNNLVNIRFLGKDNNKLLDGKCNKFSLDNNKDIVISDLCFIKFTKNVNLNIYSNYDVLIYERDNLI